MGIFLLISRHQPTVGRPRVHADVDILELRALHYKWIKIATILEISRDTLYRRLEEAGVSPDDYTPLSDQQLDETIHSIKQDHPNDGEVLLQGHLLRQGIRIPRHTLRSAIHHVDHINIVARKRSVVQHRIYSVPHPTHIWHIDGHHKLIRWHFVIHGAVDFHAQLPPSSVHTTIEHQQYLNCSVVGFQDLAYLIMLDQIMEERMWVSGGA